MGDTVLQEARDGVLRLTLHRPAARNALNRELVSELHAALSAAEANEEVRAILLTGSDPAFCAGLDLNEFTELGAEFLAAFHREDCVSLLAQLRKPVLGAINGPAFTGGLELALACDFLIASDRASFADTHAQVGVLPDAGMTARLPALIGQANARRMSLTGQVVDADAALRMGLVTEVVAHGDLPSRAAEVAATLASGAPGTVVALKRMYVAGSRPAIAHARSVESELAARHETDWSSFGDRRQTILTRNRAQLADDTR